MQNDVKSSKIYMAIKRGMVIFDLRPKIGQKGPRGVPTMPATPLIFGITISCDTWFCPIFVCMKQWKP